MCQRETKYPTREECILALLTTGGKSNLGRDLQKFYQKWASISYDNQQKLKSHVITYLSGEKKNLYESIIYTFMYWDNMQSKYGALGWDVDTDSIKILVAEMETDVRLLMNMSAIIWNNWMQKVKSSESCCCFRANKFTTAVDSDSAVEYKFKLPIEKLKQCTYMEAQAEVAKLKEIKMLQKNRAMDTLSEASEDDAGQAVPTTSQTKRRETVRMEYFASKEHNTRTEAVCKSNIVEKLSNLDIDGVENTANLESDAAEDSSNTVTEAMQRLPNDEIVMTYGIALKKSKFEMFAESDAQASEDILNNNIHGSKQSLSSTKKTFSNFDLDRHIRQAKLVGDSKPEKWLTFSDEIIDTEGECIPTFDDITCKTLTVDDIIWAKAKKFEQDKANKKL